jgi:excisionase family DNA binding protein
MDQGNRIMNDQVAFSIKQLARVHGISPGLVRLEIQRGRLKVRRFGKRIVILREDLDRYLALGPANSGKDAS